MLFYGVIFSIAYHWYHSRQLERTFRLFLAFLNAHRFSSVSVLCASLAIVRRTYCDRPCHDIVGWSRSCTVWHAVCRRFIVTTPNPWIPWDLFQPLSVTPNLGIGATTLGTLAGTFRPFVHGVRNCSILTDSLTPCSRRRWAHINPLESRGNYSATSNNMKLVHWPLMGGLLHLVQRGEAWAGWGPAQSPPRCAKCNSPPINGQCTNHRITV